MELLVKCMKCYFIEGENIEAPMQGPRPFFGERAPPFEHGVRFSGPRMPGGPGEPGPRFPGKKK